jgi:hypothetical protein
MAVGNNNQIEKRLWDAADEMRANSKLKEISGIGVRSTLYTLDNAS